MTTTNYGPFGPDDFGGDEYRDHDAEEDAFNYALGLSGETHAMAIGFQRAEAAIARARIVEARDELAAVTREFLCDNDQKSRPVLRGVRFAARLCETDEDDRGIRMSVDWRVALVFNDGASLEADGLASLAHEVGDLEDAVRRLGALAVPMDGSLLITLDGLEVS